MDVINFTLGFTPDASDLVALGNKTTPASANGTGNWTACEDCSSDLAPEHFLDQVYLLTFGIMIVCELELIFSRDV